MDKLSKPINKIYNVCKCKPMSDVINDKQIETYEKINNATIQESILDRLKNNTHLYIPISNYLLFFIEVSDEENKNNKKNNF